MLVLEECLATGCVGQRVAAMLVEKGCAPRRLLLKNLGGVVPSHGSVEQLYRQLGLDGDSVAKAIEEAVHEQ